MNRIIATKSKTRQRILSCANIAIKAVPAQIDEDGLKKSLIAEKAMPRDIADILAEYKAKKVSSKNLESWVLGCDQILDFENEVFGKPQNPCILKDMLKRFSGKTHRLITANVIYKNAKPIWRHVVVSHMTMYPMTDIDIEDYVKKAWPEVQHTAGGYYFEENPHLFSKVRGNWFDILGLSIEPVIDFLNQHNNKVMLQAPKVAAVLGHPVSHSKSPRMHQYWLQSNAVSGDYVAIDIPPQRFSKTVKVLITTGISGFNVTLPHKEKALLLSDAKSTTAEKIGAANTLVIDPKGKINAYNTDGYGFITNIKTHCKHWTPEAGSALVLGAGGASRAILVSLLEAGVPKIYLSNRTHQRALDVAAELSPLIEVLPWQHKERCLTNVMTVVNTTSLGMTGRPPLKIDISGINPAALVTDLIYVPLETPLLKQAKSLGCSVVGGIGMLLNQGVPGFEAWFGVRPVVDAEIEALVVE